MSDEMIGRFNALKKKTEIIRGETDRLIFSIEGCLERLADKDGYADIVKLDEYRSALSSVRYLKTFLQEF